VRGARSSIPECDGRRAKSRSPIATQSRPGCPRDAGSHYVSDLSPGIRRMRSGPRIPLHHGRCRTLRDRTSCGEFERWRFRRPGRRCGSRARRAPHPGGGARRSPPKKYRYHARWREVRGRIQVRAAGRVGDSLPAIRKRVDETWRAPGLPAQKVLRPCASAWKTRWRRIATPNTRAPIARADSPRSATGTWTSEGQPARIPIQGKSGKSHTLLVTDRRVARIVKACQDLPVTSCSSTSTRGSGAEIDSADVNAYLREISGTDFTATSVPHLGRLGGQALAGLRDLGRRRSAASGEQEHRPGVKRTWQRRWATLPAVCRRSYIHPALIEGTERGTLLEALQSMPRRRRPGGLTPNERLTLAFLKRSRRARRGEARRAGPGQNAGCPATEGRDTLAGLEGSSLRTWQPWFGRWL